jgi:hypothetical protein
MTPSQIILEQANKRLSLEQRIREDDPLYSAVILGEETVNLIYKKNEEYIEQAEQLGKNTILEINSLLDQERKTTKALLQDLLKESGDEIRKKAKLGLQDWEAGFHSKVDTTLNCIQATLYVFIFMCFLASIWFIIQIGNWMIIQYNYHHKPAVTHATVQHHPIHKKHR